MSKNTVITGVLMDENTTISFSEVCKTYHMSEDMLVELLEQGLFHEVSQPIKKVAFNLPMLNRIQSARRLQEDLGVNLPGVVLVLELRDELERMCNELEILRRHVEKV